MPNDVKRRRSKINRKINVVIVLLLLILAIACYWSHNFYEMQKEKNNINKGYAEEDIETINEVREFFLFYFKAEEYGVWLADLEFSNCMTIVDNSRELLRKYGEIQLDEDKKLAFNKKRKIQIVQEAFTLDTEFNVDVKSHSSNYIVSGEVVTELGTWERVNSGIPKYVLYLFGNEMDTIEFDNVPLTLSMVDISKLNFSGSVYKVDTKYYLFGDRNKYSQEYQDYYIYVIDENEWIRFTSIRDIKIENDFISFIDSDNYFYVYCIEHNSTIYVGEVAEGESLSWNYDPVYIYLPDSNNLDTSLFITHEKCNQ